jgi:hypothetical protein
MAQLVKWEACKTEQQATCTASIVSLADGSLGCRVCGWIAFTKAELEANEAHRSERRGQRRRRCRCNL